MKRLFVAAVMAALCGAPAMSRADSSASRKVAAPTRAAAQARPDSQFRDGEADEYAAREKAAPQLAEFSGGAEGIYIGAGALIAILIVVLLLTTL